MTQVNGKGGNQVRNVESKLQKPANISPQIKEAQNNIKPQETNQEKREIHQKIVDNLEKVLGKTAEAMEYIGSFVSEVTDKALETAKSNASRARGPGEFKMALKCSADLAKVSKIAKGVALGGTVINAALYYKQKLKEGKSSGRALTETAISTGSSYLGEAAGAKIGAIVGSLIAPGVGTVIGAGIGAVVGSIAGSELGSAIGSHFLDFLGIK